jgi:predicted CopG family antitoxin
MGKSVKVHDDTHRTLKELKVQKRSRSIDEVIREMIKISTGMPVERHARKSRTTELTSFLRD